MTTIAAQMMVDAEQRAEILRLQENLISSRHALDANVTELGLRRAIANESKHFEAYCLACVSAGVCRAFDCLADVVDGPWCEDHKDDGVFGDLVAPTGME